MSRRTQPVQRPLCTALAAAALALCAGLAPSQANAAQRLETIDLPSTAGNIDLAQTKLNRTDKLQADVLLPDGYDANPTKRYPVVYLLAGVGDNMSAWSDAKKGQIQSLAKGLGDAIIVMPESGRGYFLDWWRGGQRVGTRWERYYFEEVVPGIEARYRIAPGRSNHSIGGISMGGYGGLLYASQFPSYFGSAISMSGLIDLQDKGVEAILPIDIGSPYVRMFGPRTGPYATVHNPVNLVSTLKDSRIYLSSGDGRYDVRLPFSFSSITSGVVAESVTRKMALGFADKARKAGAEVTYNGYTGVHDWPYWRKQFFQLVKWNPFAPAKVTDASSNTNWTYMTMAPRGNAWGLGYKFAAPTTVIETFKRSGQVLTGTGSGSVTITPGAADADATGNGAKTQCAFTATLPFTHTLPAGC